ncbi:MAG: PAS domain-containing protein, partial [Anaerolineae bacterium]|nr:PAS domain-containing protein [Anaerolineae bacterium]
ADTYGSTPDAMVGKLDEDFNPIHAEAEHFHRDDLEVVRTCQPKFIAEEPLSNAVTGETRWYQTIKVPLMAADGQTVQLLGVATDITDRKRAQDRLEAQRNFLRQVIDLDPSFIFAKDEHGRFMLVNKALADTYGSTPDAMVGKLDEDFNPIRAEAEHFHRDDLEVVRTCQPKFIAEEPLSNAVTGETRWYQTIKVPLMAADGQTVQLLGVATDITDRKRAQDRLKAQRNFLRQVIDLDPGFIFAKDEQGRFTLVNKALADAYGATPQQMVGKYDEDFNPIREETTRFRADDREVIQTRQPLFVAEEPVTNAVTGETHWYQTTKVPLISPDEETVQLLGIATDITERKRAQEQLQELVVHEQHARREAENATKLKDLFLANMSHELRTPLNAIIGFLREMLYSQQLDDDNIHMAERCLANGQRLLMLINSVLDLSRLATGSLEIVLSEISLHTLATTIVQDLELQAKDKGLHLTLDLDPSLPDKVVHDEERLIQIVTNLVANAIKFTNDGTVNLTLKRRSDRLIIRVSDTGIGIPNTMQKIIFQDFVQLDGSSKRRYGGVGLGLSIVNNLVNLMQGCITVESEVDRFSIFTVNLPLELGVIVPPGEVLPRCNLNQC